MDTHRLTGRIDRHLLLCAALAFIIAAPVFWYFIWQGGGTFVVRDDFNAQQGTHIVSVSEIHVEPMGVYGGKQSTLDALK